MTAVLEQAPLPRGTTSRVMASVFPDEIAYVDDPDGWATERLGVESWSKPREIRESVVANRYTAVQAGHDCAKSHTVASLVCWWVDSHPPEDTLVVSTAPVHHQVQGVLWAEISGMHEAGRLPGRLTGTSGAAVPEWYVGSRRVAFGRAPDKPSYFQGYHAKFMLVIIDEAGEVPDWLFQRAEALAANEDARIVAVGNPYDPAAHFAEICQPGSPWNVIQMGAFDTPRWTGEPVSDDLIGRLVSPEYVDQMSGYGEDDPLYQITVLGQFPDVSDDTMFPPALLRRAFDETELAGLERGGYGLDIARFGQDETAMYRARGGQIRQVFVARKQDTETTADQAEQVLAVHGGANIPAVVDAIGIGAGVYDKLRRRGFNVLEFNPTEEARDKQRFGNRLSELYWTLREMCEAGEADLDPADAELRAQLGRLKWKLDGRGRRVVESKEDMRKRGVKSPDRAEAAVMALAAPVTPFDIPDRPRAGESLTDDLLDREL